MNPISPPPSKPNIPSSSPRISLLGCPVDRLDIPSIRKKVTEFFNSHNSHQIVTINSLMVLEAQDDPALLHVCTDAGLSIADSSGISWAVNYLNLGSLIRIPGIDLAIDLCLLAADLGHSVYLCGGKPGTAESAAVFLTSKIPNLKIAGIRDGFFPTSDDQAVIKAINDSGAKLILIGLGMPKQEMWIHKYLVGFRPGVVLMGIGGSFDVWAGNINRAPQLFQKLGVEWLYRVIQEPFRWGRILQLPKFALKIISEKRTPRR